MNPAVGSFWMRKGEQPIVGRYGVNAGGPNVFVITGHQLGEPAKMYGPVIAFDRREGKSLRFYNVLHRIEPEELERDWEEVQL